MTKPDHLDLRSLDIADDRKRELLRLFPEIRTEAGKIDFDLLRLVLGDTVDAGKERYGLTWPGKADCFKTIQAPSIGTLRPCPEESVNFDTSENLIIEGDNLEVLKLLQKSYLGKIKMIYIDPPYNTGNDFIYPDNFAESLQTYLEYSGQIDSQGRKFNSNTDSDGRFHSKWLSMMYPRLYIARDLLNPNGVIFVTIDDNEFANLRVLMNYVFGEENFVATVIWQKVFSPKNTAQHFSQDHDFVLIYARNAESWRPILLPRSEEADARYENPDRDKRGPWTSSDLTARNYYGEGQYEVTGPSGKEFTPARGRYWVIKKEDFLALQADDRVWWGHHGDSMPRRKRFLAEVKQGIVPQTLWQFDDVGHTQEAKKELLEFVQFEHTENVLNSVKPVRLIQRMLQLATSADSDDIVLDFFSGSGTTGHAVLQQNSLDQGSRQFICVQLPEPLPTPEYGLATIADMGKERIRRVIKKLTTAGNGQLALGNPQAPDLGFRVFKLAESNFKPWNAEIAHDEDTLAQQLQLQIDHIREGRTAEDILYEILLKSGYPLTTSVEALVLAGQQVYSVAGGLLLVCLDRPLLLETVRAMADLLPERVVCLDEGFANNDQAKANAVQIFKTKGVASFKTV